MLCKCLMDIRKLLEKMGLKLNRTNISSPLFNSVLKVSPVDRSHSFSFSSTSKPIPAPRSRPPTPAPRALASRSSSEPNLLTLATVINEGRYRKKGNTRRSNSVLPSALSPMNMYNTRQDLIHKLLNSTQSGDDPSSPCISICSSDDSPPRGSLARHRKWNNTDSFIQDNLAEVYEKLGNLEKQIWGKLIVMEGSRRTAKAYLRHPLITIDGSGAEFDGLRIGLSGFGNTERSSLVREIFNEMVEGIKLKIDPDGNVWAKRLCFSPVFLKPLYKNSPNDLFVIDHRPVKVFDIRMFKELLVSELRSGRADRRRLEKSCVICIKFSVDHYELLSTPCWIAIVHLVAIELLNLVLPKDHEMSSPSSSFVAGPTGLAARKHQHPPQMVYPNPPSILTPPRALSRTPRGAVFKRIVRKDDFNSSGQIGGMHDLNYYGSAQAMRAPYKMSSGDVDCNMSMMGGMRDAFNTSSLLDLRAISAVKSPVYFQRGSENRESCRPGRGGMGQRVLSADALHVMYPESVPKGVHPARWDNHSQLVRRWKSQDSGIGSGGDSFGSRAADYP